MTVTVDQGAGLAPPRVTRLRQLDPKPDQVARLERYNAGVLRDWRRWYELNGKPSPLPSDRRPPLRAEPP